MAWLTLAKSIGRGDVCNAWFRRFLRFNVKMDGCNCDVHGKSCSMVVETENEYDPEIVRAAVQACRAS